MRRSDMTVDPIDPTTRYEHTDLHAKWVVLTGAGVVVGMWIVVLLVYPVFAYFSHPAHRAAIRPNPQPPGPRLQAHPRLDLRDFRAYEESTLNRYGWVDRAHGIASIPIEDAIKIVASRGIPSQSAPDKLTYFDPRAGTRQTGFEGKVEPEAR